MIKEINTWKLAHLRSTVIHKTSNSVQRSTPIPEGQSSSMESMPDSKGAISKYSERQVLTNHKTLSEAS